MTITIKITVLLLLVIIRIVIISRVNATTAIVVAIMQLTVYLIFPRVVIVVESCIITVDLCDMTRSDWFWM